MNFFFDLNMWSRNVCLEKVRGYVSRVADWHGVNLARDKSNEEALRVYDGLYPSSPYQNPSWDVISTFQPDDTSIQRVVSHH